MSEKQGRRNWTREETTLALALYLCTPTNKIRENNPNVLLLAEAFNRTPTAVKMKLFNLGSHDILLKQKNFHSLENGSKIDEEIWNKYMGENRTKSLESFLDDVDGIAGSLELNLPFIGRAPGKVGETKTIAQVKLGRRQDFFRNTVLSMYNNRCLVTGLSLPPLIEVAHIIPWAEDASLRLVPANGLTLNPLIHRAYDATYLGIDPDMNIHVCQELMDKSQGKLQELFENVNGTRLLLPENVQPAPEYLERHYEAYLRHEHHGEVPCTNISL